MLNNPLRDPRTFSPDDPGSAPPPADPPPTLIGGSNPPPADPPSTDPPPADPFAAIEDLAAVLPEGFSVPEAEQADLLKTINEAASRTDLVKGLMALHAKSQAQLTESLASAWNDTQAAWQNEIKTAPEFTGEKLGPALSAAKEMAVLLGGDDLLKAMDLTGMGNNVHFLRALLKAKELIPGEAKPKSGAPAVPEKTLAQRIFQTT